MLEYLQVGAMMASYREPQALLLYPLAFCKFLRPAEAVLREARRV